MEYPTQFDVCLLCVSISFHNTFDCVLSLVLVLFFPCVVFERIPHIVVLFLFTCVCDRESGGTDNMWFSFDYGLVHYVQISTETDFPNGVLLFVLFVCLSVCLLACCL